MFGENDNKDALRRFKGQHLHLTGRPTRTWRQDILDATGCSLEANPLHQFPRSKSATSPQHKRQVRNKLATSPSTGKLRGNMSKRQNQSYRTQRWLDGTGQFSAKDWGLHEV